MIFKIISAFCLIFVFGFLFYLAIRTAEFIFKKGEKKNEKD